MGGVKQFPGISINSDLCRNIEEIKNKIIEQKEVHDKQKNIFIRLMITIYSHIIIFFLTVFFFLIKFILVIYHFIICFTYILLCTINKLFGKCLKRKKKLPRPSSGFLNTFTEKEDVIKEKLTIILDLDHTLVCALESKLPLSRQNDICTIYNNLYIYKRPHLENFISSISNLCDIVLYTASKKEYADHVVNSIDKNNLISRRFNRNECVQLKDNLFLKNVMGINKLWNENNCLIIDDCSESHMTLKSILFTNIRECCTN
jgi:hypothetical protein